jgi:hypothetical protein
MNPNAHDPMSRRDAIGVGGGTWTHRWAMNHRCWGSFLTPTYDDFVHIKRVGVRVKLFQGFLRRQPAGLIQRLRNG